MSMRPKTVGSSSIVFNTNLGKKDNKANNKLSGQADLLRNKVNDFNDDQKLSPAESAFEDLISNTLPDTFDIEKGPKVKQDHCQYCKR